MQIPPAIHQLAQAIDRAGGRLYLVGGGVRDHLLGVAHSDMDLEAHGLEADRVLAILERFGHTKEVGKSFGVFKLKLDGHELDVALPRSTDRSGRQVLGEPHLGVREASRRRDLTVNALLYDILEERVLDLHGGVADLEAGLLRECAPDTFRADPLRALRAVRFAAALDFEMTDSLRALCAEASLDGVAEERLRVELEKILLRSPRPGRALRLLLELDLLEPILPGLAALSPGDHPEALDRAAQPRDAQANPQLGYALIVAALLSPGGPQRAEGWLLRLRIKRFRGLAIRQLICSLIAALPALSDPIDDAGLRALADAAPLALLLPLAQAITPSLTDRALGDRALALGVAEGPLPRLLAGRTLIKIGVPPGAAVGQILQALRAAQHQGQILTRAQAIAAARALIP